MPEAKRKKSKKPAKSRPGKGSKSAKKGGKKKVSRTANTADKHELYQLSVQAPDVDAPFIARYFKRYIGRPARVMREDFCGTGHFAAYWVQMHRENRAIGVDLDRSTLAWGMKHNVKHLLDDEQQTRIKLVEANVMTVEPEPVDIVTAFNFSYSLLMTRDSLRQYFVRAKEALVPGGMLLIDAWGGSETIEDREEERRVEDFTYVWDQHDYDPISNRSDCRIHFRFKDGTEIRNAFRYQWRMWSLPELMELMTDAGYEDVHVLWEGTDSKTGEGNGIFKRVKRGEADPSWICYVVGRA